MKCEILSRPLPAPSMNTLHQLIIDGSVMLERITIIDNLEVTWLFNNRPPLRPHLANALRQLGMAAPGVSVNAPKQPRTLSPVARPVGRPAAPVIDSDDEPEPVMQAQPYQLAQAQDMRRATPLIEHTKTPWRFIPHIDNVESDRASEPILGTILDGNFHIARIWSDNPNALADAAFIITAVNAHDALVQAVEEALFTFGRAGGNALGGTFRDEWEAMRNALAKVR